MEIVKNVMDKKFLKVKPTDDVVFVAKKMLKGDYGCALVYEGKKAIGIITERDMVRRVVAKGCGLVPVKTVMSGPIMSIEEDVNIFYAGKLMKDKGFKRLPVSKKGKIIGVLTDTGLTNYFTVKKKDEILKARDSFMRQRSGLMKKLKK